MKPSFPISRCSFDEGRLVDQAVRKHQIGFQTGPQPRSSKHFRLACELARNGRIGKLKEVQVFVAAGLQGGPFQHVPGPNGFNYDFWLGPAAPAVYCKKRCHTSLPCSRANSCNGIPSAKFSPGRPRRPAPRCPRGKGARLAIIVSSVAPSGRPEILGYRCAGLTATLAANLSS